MQSNNILTLLNNSEAQSFLTKERGQPVAELAIQYHGKPLSFDLKAALSLLSIYNKAVQKIPSLIHEILPALDEKTYQQCSSDLCAKYKVGLISPRSKVLDLTGGIGIDDYFLAKAGHEVESYDLDIDVHKMAQYNFDKLSLKHIKRIHGDGTLLKSYHKFDVVLVDPDRRIGEERSIILEHSSPNVIELQKEVLNSSILITKASPMIDLTYAVNRLDHLKEIHVVSIQREIKEIIFIQESGHEDQIDCFAVDLNQNGNQKLSGVFQNEIEPFANDIYSFLYVAQSNAVKSQICFSEAKLKGMTSRGSLHQPLFFLDQYEEIPLFDTFQVLTDMPYQPKTLKKSIQKNNITRASFRCKSTPLKAASLSKKFNLPAGDEFHIFFYLFESKYRCLIAKRI